MDIKEYSKLDKSQTERTGWANETEDAGYRRTNGKRPFPGQLPAGRIRKRGITPVAESEKAVLGTDRCGRELRDAALRKEPSFFSSVKYMPGEYRVRVAKSSSMRAVNNWGGEVHPTATPQLRRFAWAKYYQASGKAKRAATGKSKGKKKGSAVNNESQENQEALKWKRLALTKKKKLRIKIPQRQFIGESRELSEKIDRKMENEIRNILNL